MGQYLAPMQGITVLTRWGQNKMAANFLTTFPNAFYWIKIYKSRLWFQLIILSKAQKTIFLHWFRKWPGASQATRHYLNHWWLVYWRIYSSVSHNELIYSSRYKLKMHTTVLKWSAEIRQTPWYNLFTVNPCECADWFCKTSVGNIIGYWTGEQYHSAVLWHRKIWRDITEIACEVQFG